MPRPSRLEDPSFHDGTTFVQKGGVTLEVLNSDLAHYKSIGFTVVEAGEASGPTSYTDQEKVKTFARIKRSFVVPNSEFPSE
jgi:hypothetical protein